MYFRYMLVSLFEKLNLLCVGRCVGDGIDLLLVVIYYEYEFCKRELSIR